MSREDSYKGKFRLGPLVAALRVRTRKTAQDFGKELIKSGIDGGTSGSVSVADHGRTIPGMKEEGGVGEYINAVSTILNLEEKDRVLVEDAAARDVLNRALGAQMAEKVIRRWTGRN